jgi:general stress protein YciG
VLGDRGAQLRPAEGFGVAERDPPQCLSGGREHRVGRTAARLAHLHVDHVGPGGGASVGGNEHVHDDERIDLGTAGGPAGLAVGRAMDIEAGLSSVSRSFCHNGAGSATDARTLAAIACDHHPGLVV